MSQLKQDVQEQGREDDFSDNLVLSVFPPESPLNEGDKIRISIGTERGTDNRRKDEVPSLQSKESPSHTPENLGMKKKKKPLSNLSLSLIDDNEAAVQEKEKKFISPLNSKKPEQTKPISHLHHHLSKLQMQVKNFETRPSLNKLRNIELRITRGLKWLNKEYIEDPEYVDVVEQMYWLVDTVDRKETVELMQSNEDSIELKEDAPLLTTKEKGKQQRRMEDLQQRYEVLTNIQKMKMTLKRWLEEAYNLQGKEFITTDVFQLNPNADWIMHKKRKYRREAILLSACVAATLLFSTCTILIVFIVFIVRLARR